MTYRKANRHLTEEQFSEGTTIDGTRIDKALDDMVEHQNNIPKGDFQGRWMPVTYVMSWLPSRPRWRGAENGAVNIGLGAPDWMTPSYCYGQANHWFPWLHSRNWEGEVYPVDQPPQLHAHPDGVQNEWRHKGFFHNKTIRSNPGQFVVPNIPASAIIPLSAEQIEQSLRSAWVTLPVDATFNSGLQSGPYGAAYGNWLSPILFQHMASTVPMFFHKPVIITGVSVYGASSHPYNFYSSQNAGGFNPYAQINDDGYKSAVATAVQKYESECFQATPSATTGVFLEGEGDDWYGARVGQTGNEFPGEKYTNASEDRPDSQDGGENFGFGTIEISIDNEFNSEDRLLNTVAFKKWNMGTDAQRFNIVPPTGNTSGAVAAGHGTQFTDMEPAYHGGPHWGVWVREDKLNIPIPRDSRVRLAVITQGMRNTQLFEWHMAITVLEEIE